jgi:DNA adenine methylase
MARIRAGQAAGQLPQERLFFYLDPPFFEKAAGLYRFCFADSDHRQLRDELLGLEDSWVLSYDSAQQVQALYGISPNGTPNRNGTKNYQVEFHYSVSMLQEPKKGKEVILSNMEELPEFG